MLKFNKTYLTIAIILFLAEVMIALFIHDTFIRPVVGDYLVVILIYCFIKSFLKLSVSVAASSALFFAFFVEIAQYFNIVGRLGLQNSGIAKVVIGNSFSWIDLIAYTMGILSVIVVEKFIVKG